MASHLAHDIEASDRTEDVQINESITFDTMLLPSKILDGLKSLGFKKPSPIQLAAIPIARCGLDLIVQAKSGTGKTLVFTITALESINIDIKRVQVIVIAPTREIAIQIKDVIKSVGKSMKGLKVGVFVGGRAINMDKPVLQGCHIAVGCPGRLRHLIEQKTLDSQAVRLLVLDEADKLFETESDYQKDINYIFNKCGESKQVLALSATYPPQMLEFTQRFMRSGQHITPNGNPTPILVGVRQMVYITRDHPDYNARMSFKELELFHILETVSFDVCCIFHQYATRAESMNNILRKRGFASTCLTGKQLLDQRMEAMEGIKSGKYRILSTTDLTARGIDAANINLVINMNVPSDPASYLHRMGRSGRYGSQGLCISIVSEGIELKKLQKLLGKIGGTSMFVHVIPQDRKCDQWNDDLADFEKVYGVVSADEENSEVSTDEFEIIQYDSVEESFEKLSFSDENKKQLKITEQFSLKDLQLEFDTFKEKEHETKKEMAKQENVCENTFETKCAAPATYSQIVSGVRKSDSSSSFEVVEKHFNKARGTPRKSPKKKHLPKPNPEDNKKEALTKSLTFSRAFETNKRKRNMSGSSSISSEFTPHPSDVGSETDGTNDTKDDSYDEDSRSGIDLNIEHDDFESLSDIGTDDLFVDGACINCFYSEGGVCSLCDPPPLLPNHTFQVNGTSYTDWYSLISYQINFYLWHLKRNGFQ